MAGGGIGEAALIGAAVGGGSALLSGKDPLEGAIMGGTLGGVGGALGGGASGAAGSAGPISPGAAANGILTNAAAGGDVLRGMQLNSSLLAGAPDVSGAFSVPGATTPSLAPMTGSAVSNIPSMAATTPSLTGAANSVAAAAPAAQPGFFQNLINKYSALSTPEKIGVGIAGSTLLNKVMEPNYLDEGGGYQPLKRFKYDPRKFRPSVAYADGGIASLPMRSDSSYSPQMMENMSSAEPVVRMKNGGISDLGGYSDGGRLLKGPGDGVSDGIPAMIGRKQPARLADGEFVIPARIVSELGNGSTDAGARQLYAMMDRVQAGRRKTVGKNKVAVDSKASKMLPA